VGGRGWVGIELDRVKDKELALHLKEAWRLIAPDGVFRDTQTEVCTLNTCVE
jgi:hypothetical protein